MVSRLNRERNSRNYSINFLTRLQELSEIEREALISHLQSISRLAQIRRIDYSDNEEEDDDKYIDIDFRTYPITINWYNIENDKKNYFSVLEKYGYIGVGVYTAMDSEVNIRMNNEKMLSSLLDSFSLFMDNAFLDNQLLNFINCLPSIQVSYNIIANKIFQSKEILVFIILLLIYEKYYNRFEQPLYTSFIEEVISAQIALYSNVTDEEWSKAIVGINEDDKIKHSLRRLKTKLYNTRKEYLCHINSMKVKYQKLFKGLSKKDFII